MEFKVCFVSGCTSTGSQDCKKWFVPVPKEMKRRLAWFIAGQREFIPGESNTKTYWCCSDHFNVQEDTETCVDVSGNLRTRLKHSVVPKPVVQILSSPVKPNEDRTLSSSGSSVVSVETPKTSIASTEQNKLNSNNSGKVDDTNKLSSLVQLLREPIISMQTSTGGLKESIHNESSSNKKVDENLGNNVPPKVASTQEQSAPNVSPSQSSVESSATKVSLQLTETQGENQVHRLGKVSSNTDLAGPLSASVSSLPQETVQMTPVQTTEPPQKKGSLSDNSQLSNIGVPAQISPPVRIGVLPQPPPRKEPIAAEPSINTVSLSMEEEREKRLEALYSSVASLVPSLSNKVGLSRVNILDEVISYVEQMRAKAHQRKAERGFLAATTYQLKQNILEVEMLQERLEKGDIVMSKEEFCQRFNITDLQPLNKLPQRKYKRRKKNH